MQRPNRRLHQPKPNRGISERAGRRINGPLSTETSSILALPQQALLGASTLRERHHNMASHGQRLMVQQVPVTKIACSSGNDNIDSAVTGNR